MKKVTIGISGGLDSTLAVLVAARAFDKLGLSRDGIVAITMPGFGTTDRTYQNALGLMKPLGTTVREISIGAAVRQHFEDIDHDPNKHDVTYENAQARERTQILMDVANELGGFVVGTGDLSDCTGVVTFNGDHMSMYHVNAGVPKTLVRYLVRWAADEEFSGDARACCTTSWTRRSRRSCCRSTTARCNRRPKTQSAHTSCTISSCCLTCAMAIRHGRYFGWRARHSEKRTRSISSGARLRPRSKQTPNCVRSREMRVRQSLTPNPSPKRRRETDMMTRQS